jgi:uncharacterized protein (DUF58 family)
MFALFVFTQAVTALVALVLSLVLPLICVLINRFGARFLSVSLETAPTSAKGVGIPGWLGVVNRSPLPTGRIVCRLLTLNYLTGDDAATVLSFFAGGRTAQRVAFTLTSSRCGRVRVGVKSVEVRDLFGISARTVAAEAQCLVTVLPETFAPALVLTSAMSLDLEGVEYSAIKPGFDPSERFGIREYQPGDGVNSIHWKLSEKYDQLMVKQASLPIDSSFCLLWETTLLPGVARPAPAVRDAMVEVYCSIAQALAEKDLPFEVAWVEHESGVLLNERVQVMEDLLGYIPRLMATDLAVSPEPDLDSYLHRKTTPSAHVIHVTAQPPGRTADGAEAGMRVTTLFCTDGTETVSELVSGPTDAGELIVFGPDDYERELAWLDL